MATDGIFGVDGWLLVVASILVFAGVAAVTRVVAARVGGEEQRSRVVAIVGPLTPALAALFSVMVAFTVVTEAGYLRTGQDLASDEAAAASRLAWASTNPSIDGAAIRADLAEYLATVVRVDWSGRAEGERTPPAVARVTRRLEATTRARADAAGVSSAVASELLTALDGVTSTRRELVAESTRRIPTGYLAMLALAGVALVVNVSVLTVSGRRRTMGLIVGVVLVVSTSLALLVGVSASFAGPLRVDHDALDRVVADLRSGYFSAR